MTSVRSLEGDMQSFPIDMDCTKGQPLQPILLAMIFEKLKKMIQNEVP